MGILNQSPGPSKLLINILTLCDIHEDCKLADVGSTEFVRVSQEGEEYVATPLDKLEHCRNS